MGATPMMYVIIKTKLNYHACAQLLILSVHYQVHSTIGAQLLIHVLLTTISALSGAQLLILSVSYQVQHFNVGAVFRNCYNYMPVIFNKQEGPWALGSSPEND